MTVIAKLLQTPGRGWRWRTSESGVTIDEGLDYHATAALAEAAAQRALGTGWPGSATENFATVNDAEEDGWHYIGTTGEPAFENDWGELAFAPLPAFRIREAGVVDLHGGFTGGDGGTVVFTLPEGYRPSAGTIVLGVGLSDPATPAFLSIATNGEVTCNAPTDVPVIVVGQFFLDVPTAA